MSTRVYIGRLARDAEKRDLEKLFRNYGDIREINIKTGFGFAEFANERDAKDVVYDFHGKNFLGERLIVEIARGARRNDERRPKGNDRRRSHYRLIVENIAPGTNWQDLKDMMRKAGEVTFADISRDRLSEGIVEFALKDDMEYALKKLNDRELNGQRVTLREDSMEKRHSDRSSRSDRRSDRRSPSRSRSRSRTPPRRRRRSPSRSRSRSVPRRRRRSSPSRSRSPSGTRSPPRKREKRERSDREDSRDEAVKSESRSRSRSPAKSSAHSADAQSPAGSPRSDGSLNRDD